MSVLYRTLVVPLLNRIDLCVLLLKAFYGSQCLFQNSAVCPGVTLYGWQGDRIRTTKNQLIPLLKVKGSPWAGWDFARETVFLHIYMNAGIIHRHRQYVHLVVLNHFPKASCQFVSTEPSFIDIISIVCFEPLFLLP